METQSRYITTIEKGNYILEIYVDEKRNSEQISLDKAKVLLKHMLRY